MLHNEKDKVGQLEILGKLVSMQPHGKALIVGDLHGDFESIVDILKSSNYLETMTRDKEAFLIFLGDYGDRGPFSVEVYYAVMKLKLLLPTQVILLRGNHEGPSFIQASPHDLPEQFKLRFKENWREAYRELRKLFDELYLVVLVKRRYLMIHGGVPTEIVNYEDLAFASKSDSKRYLLEQILWNDPDETIIRSAPSPRGAGVLFGEEITREILERLNVRILIRGHEPCENGYEVKHNGRVLTLFSRKGSPYFNSKAAYLMIDLSREIGDAHQLVPYIHTF